MKKCQSFHTLHTATQRFHNHSPDLRPLDIQNVCRPLQHWCQRLPYSRHTCSIPISKLSFSQQLLHSKHTCSIPISELFHSNYFIPNTPVQYLFLNFFTVVTLSPDKTARELNVYFSALRVPGWSCLQDDKQKRTVAEDSDLCLSWWGIKISWELASLATLP